MRKPFRANFSSDSRHSSLRRRSLLALKSTSEKMTADFFCIVAARKARAAARAQLFSLNEYLTVFNQFRRIRIFFMYRNVSWAHSLRLRRRNIILDRRFSAARN